MPKTKLREKVALILLGVILSLVLLELGLRLGGWAFLSFQAYHNQTAVSKGKGAYRILCLGESTTARSIAFDEGESSYPSQLQEVLNQRAGKRKFVVINAGVPGITTTGILKELPDNLNKYAPDMVITMMGINDRENILPADTPFLSRILSFLELSRAYKFLSLLGSRCLYKLMVLQKDDLPLDAPPSEKLKQEEMRLKTAIEVHPDDPKAYLALGRYYLEIARFPEAEEMFIKAIHINASEDAAYFGLGECYADTAKFKEAEALFQKTLAINPQNYDASLELGLYYLQEGRLSDAEEMLKAVIARAPGNSKAYTLLGQFYVYVRRDPEAEAALKTALELDPENYDALLASASLYKNTQRFQEAEKTYAGLDAIKPKTYKGYVTLGACDLQAGRPRQGEAMLRRALVINPRGSEAYLELSGFYYNQGQYPKAESALKKAIALDPENKEAYLRLGRNYISRQKYAEAWKLLKEALQLSPGHQGSYKPLETYEATPGSFRLCVAFGDSFFRATRLREAKKIFHKILEINPRNYEICLRLAKCYRAAGRLSETEEFLKRAITIDPTESRAYFRLGCLYQVEARYKEAELTWLKGLAVNPQNYSISSKLVQLYSQEKRFQESNKIYKNTFSSGSKNYETYLELGGYPKPITPLREAEAKMSVAPLPSFKGDKMLEDRLASYRESTIANYLKLRDILSERGIKLTVVQYPCRSINPLKDIFQGQEGILFVDNENTFKEALKRGDYKEYFNDRFAGDFGHCTRKGNRLLADNIARTIIQAEGPS